MANENETTCPNCGAPLRAGLESCSHCGAMLAQPEALDVEPNPLLTMAELAPEPEPTPEPPAAPAVVGAVETPTAHVIRAAAARINQKIPQEAVDKQRWLSEAQWERVLELYQAALTDRLRLDMEAGRPLDLTQQSARVLVPWDQVGDNLTESQRVEIEQGLHQLLGSAAQKTTTSAQTVTPGGTPQAYMPAGCTVLIFIVGLLAAGATFYLIMHH